MAGRGQKLAATALPFLKEALCNPAAPRSFPLPSLRRTYSLFDQVNVMSGTPEDRIRIEGYSDIGFTANGVEYEGSLICISNLILSWSPKRFADITPDSLSIFQVLHPVPEILVLGCGRRTELVDPMIRNFLRSNGIKLEAVDSRNAASTFNFLSEEGRIAAAAFLPPGAS